MKRTLDPGPLLTVKYLTLNFSHHLIIFIFLFRVNSSRSKKLRSRKIVFLVFSRWTIFTFSFHIF